MMGSFLSRALIMVFGYAYPAYECFKTVENNKPDIRQLLYWCKYWILVVILTICERLGDILISWLPMYNEAKLAFFIYLWHHKTSGTLDVYDCFFRPIMKKHEKEIDNSLLELRVRGGEIALHCWEKAATYGHTKFFEIFQYASSQSVSRPQSWSQQEVKATSDKLSVYEPISQQAAKDRLCKVTNSNCNHQQHQSTEVGKLPDKQLPSNQNGNLEISHQQDNTPDKEYVHKKHSRWRFFKN